MRLAGAMVVLFVAVIAGGVGCDGHSNGSGSSVRTISAKRTNPTTFLRSDARALNVSYAPIPPLPVKHFVTRGVYPRVSSPDMDLRAVNAALRRTVLEDERRFRREMDLQESQQPRKWRWHDRAIYQTWNPHRGSWGSPGGRILISASSVVVSALFPEWGQPPRANAETYQTFLSVTVRVPSGSPVAIVDLFAKPAQGLRALAAAVRHQFAAKKAKGGPSLDYPGGLAPKAENYRLFALTPSGLVIGFHDGVVAHPIFGPLKIRVPYSVLRPYLSDLGKRLVSGIRKPRFEN